MSVLRRVLRALRATCWRLAVRAVRWATHPRDRRARIVALTSATWVGAYLAMSVLDFLRVGGPTWLVVIVPSVAAAGVAAGAWAAAVHPGAHTLVDVVTARRVSAGFSSGRPARIAGLAEAVERHRVASSCAPRRLRRAQRDQVRHLVGEVNGFVRSANAVGLVRVDLTDGSVHAVPGSEASYQDLCAVAAHRARRIDELTAAATAASLDQRHAVAGHLDQVAVAARLSAQRRVDSIDDPAAEPSTSPSSPSVL